MTVFLTGYRGSGKTTVGRLAAQRLSRTFFDSDELIVSRAGKTIKEIFAARGETGFRDLESQIIAELALLDSHVVALGGGAFLREQNRAVIKARPHRIIYLHCNPAELHRRIHADPATAKNRPSLTHLGGGIEEIQRLLFEREPIYKSMMTDEIDVTHLSAEQAAEKIEQLVLSQKS